MVCVVRDSGVRTQHEYHEHSVAMSRWPTQVFTRFHHDFTYSSHCSRNVYLLPTFYVLTGNRCADCCESVYLKLDYEHNFFFLFPRQLATKYRQTSISRTSCLRTLRVDQSKLSALTELFTVIIAYMLAGICCNLVLTSCTYI